VSTAPRSRAQRRRDAEHRLTHDVDVCVARALADGAPYLVPLSFDWDGEALFVTTPTDSLTAGAWPTAKAAPPNSWRPDEPMETR
jgi:hypothetical protein